MQAQELVLLEGFFNFFCNTLLMEQTVNCQGMKVPGGHNKTNNYMKVRAIVVLWLTEALEQNC